MTQSERILAHLKERGSITQIEAMRDYGIMRLASRINDLRRAGYSIKTETVSGKNRFGDATLYAKYTLMEG